MHSFNLLFHPKDTTLPLPNFLLSLSYFKSFWWIKSSIVFPILSKQEKESRRIRRYFWNVCPTWFFLFPCKNKCNKLVMIYIVFKLIMGWEFRTFNRSFLAIVSEKKWITFSSTACQVLLHSRADKGLWGTKCSPKFWNVPVMWFGLRTTRFRLCCLPTQSPLIQVLLLPFYYFIRPWSLFLEHFWFLIFSPFFFFFPGPSVMEAFPNCHFSVQISLLPIGVTPLFDAYKSFWNKLRLVHLFQMQTELLSQLLHSCFSHKLNNVLNLSLHAVFKHTKKLFALLIT